MTRERFRAASLQSTPFMKSELLSAEDRRALSAMATQPRLLRAGTSLVAEGVRTDSVHILIEGWAARYKITRKGHRQITGLVVAGDICNLDSFMLDRINFGVRTLTEATVVGLPRDQLQALAAERPGVARAFAWFAIVENAMLNEQALSLGRHSAQERLAHFLCEMAVRLGKQRENSAEYILPITQEQIADALGLTPVHINRTMRQLRSDGLIVVDKRTISVPNLDELGRAGGFDASYLHAVP